METVIWLYVKLQASISRILSAKIGHLMSLVCSRRYHQMIRPRLSRALACPPYLGHVSFARSERRLPPPPIVMPAIPLPTRVWAILNARRIAKARKRMARRERRVVFRNNFMSGLVVSDLPRMRYNEAKRATNLIGNNRRASFMGEELCWWSV